MKMKRKITTTVAILALALSGATVYADDLSVDSQNQVEMGVPQGLGQDLRQQKADWEDKIREKHDELRQELDVKRQEIEKFKQEKGGQIEKRRDEIVGRLQNLEQKGERMKNNFVKVVTKRIDLSITRMLKLADRVQSRIDKSKALGFSVGQAETYLAQAHTSITDAQTAFATLSGLIQTGSTPADATAAMDQVSKIKTSLGDAKTHLGEAVDEIVKYAPKPKLDAKIKVEGRVDANVTNPSNEAAR